MNCSGIKRLAAVMVLLGVVGCSPSVEQVADESVKEVSAMSFVADPDQIIAQLQSADDRREVERLVADARAENEQRKAMYWQCVQPAAVLLGDRVWSTQIIEDGHWSVLELELSKGGEAALRRVATAEMIGDEPAREDERWLAGLVGNVTGWSSTLEKQMTDRALLVDRPRLRDAQTCNLMVDVTLETSSGAVTQRMELARNRHGVALIVGETPFDPHEAVS